MKPLLLISLLTIGALCSTLEDQLIKDLYHQWKQSHNKLYPSSLEDNYRFNVFTQNYLSILDYNSQREDSDDAFLGLNEFADLTSEEFSLLYLGTFSSESSGEFFKFDTSQDPPPSVDWRDKGAVTPVKKQGTCGSCWAFSATGALEGLYFLNNSQLVSFSEQNLVDCVTKDHGCVGGWPFDAFDYTAEVKGIQSEADYPYKGKDGTCAFESDKAYEVNSGYYNVTRKDLTQLKLAIAQQPVSVGIEADGLNFQFYMGGVIKYLCGNIINHGVLAVGYDTFKGGEAFIVKNSWGPKWGKEGYVYISTNPDTNRADGVCGILKVPAIPYKK